MLPAGNIPPAALPAINHEIAIVQTAHLLNTNLIINIFRAKATLPIIFPPLSLVFVLTFEKCWEKYCTLVYTIWQNTVQCVQRTHSPHIYLSKFNNLKFAFCSVSSYREQFLYFSTGFFNPLAHSGGSLASVDDAAGDAETSLSPLSLHPLQLALANPLLASVFATLRCGAAVAPLQTGSSHPVVVLSNLAERYSFQLGLLAFFLLFPSIFCQQIFCGDSYGPGIYNFFVRQFM